MASAAKSRALNTQDTAKGSRSGAQDTVMGGRSSAQDIAKGWREVGERRGEQRGAQTGAIGAQKMVSDYISSTKPEDVAFMRRALELAEQHRGRTSPNPIVGCVIVDAQGHVIAEGAHRGPGQAHAEVDALAKLARGATGGSGANAETTSTAPYAANVPDVDGVAGGATMYVNLEPCTHHGRTPPCVLAVMASGVARVVVGSEDPVPGHGGGMEMLRRAGISVERALVAESDAANRPFFTWARESRPAFTLKAAVTLDGKIATVAGQSRWITGEVARADGRKMRDTHDAILVGVGTVIADDPELTTRLPGGRDPIRIILDSTLRIPMSARVLRGGPRTIIATTSRASNLKEQKLVKMGVEVWRIEPASKGSGSSKRAGSSKRTGSAKGARSAGSPAAVYALAGRAGRGVALDVLGKWLAQEGITSVLVEGGGEVHASFLAADLADELCIYVAPKIVGGPAPSWVGGTGIGEIELAHPFSYVDATMMVGGDLRLRAVRRR